jgi:hypothetical protein
MKSTKNLLITGLVVVTALFTSIQLFADLTGAQLNRVTEEIDNQKSRLKDLEELRNIRMQQGNEAQANRDHKMLLACLTTIEKLQKLSRTEETYNDRELSDKIRRIKQ